MRKFLIVMLLCVSLAGGFTLGQELTGRVTGTVVDEAGNPIEGALVTVQSPNMQGERQMRTDAKGQFLFALLRVGPYRVTISAPNMEVKDISFQLGLGQTVPLDVVLEPGAERTEEVTVYGTATAMETTAGGENFSYDNKVEQLPITDRGIEAVATYAPNISFGPTAGTLSIAGAPSFDTIVLLDGAEVSDPYFGGAPELYLQDAVEEVQVMTTGVSARYGRFQGGVISAITKSGGNEFSGTVRMEIEKESWNSKTPYSRETQDDEMDETYQGTLGGYVLKDHLWFFGGTNQIPSESASSTTLFTGESYTTTAEEDRWQLKLRGALNPNHIVELSHLEYERDTTGRAGLPAGDLDAATGVRSDPRETYTLNYEGVLASNLFLNVIATQKEVSIASGGDPARGNPFYWANRFWFFNNHWWDKNDPSIRDNDTLSANLTHVISTQDWGDHTFEYGAQYVKSTTGGENRQSSTGYNLITFDLTGREFVQTDPETGELRFYVDNIFAGDPGLAYRWEALPLGGDQEIENTALYVQDSWTMGNWRFDLGMRYEMYDATGPFEGLDNFDFTQLAPRLAATYNITPLWQVQMSYGKYVSRFNDNVAGDVSGVGSAPMIETLYTGPPSSELGLLTYDEVDALIEDDDNWGFVTFLNDPQQPTTFLGDTFTAPYANDFNVSIKHAFKGGAGTVSLTYTKRGFEKLLDDFIGTNGTITATDPKGSGAEFVFDKAIWKNTNLAERDYQAFTLAFNYRPGFRWNVGGNWTFSETTGNYEGEGTNTPSSGSIIGNYPQLIPVDQAAPFGYLDEDIRHRGRAWGNYRFDFGRWGALVLGSTFTYQSGRAWNRTASAALPSLDEDQLDALGIVNPPRSYTRYYDGRGNNRFNDWWRLDLSGRYQIPVWSDISSWLKVSILNVLDNDELTSYQTSGETITNAAGQQVWSPTGTCGPGDEPSEDCTGFGRIRNENDYQLPRTYLVTLGIQF